jgi:hypothetical protein
VYLQLNGYELFWYGPILFGLKLVGHLSNWRITQRLTNGIIRAVSLKIWGWAHEDQIGEQAQIDAGSRAPKGRIVIPSSLVRHWELSSSSSRK